MGSSTDDGGLSIDDIIIEVAQGSSLSFFGKVFGKAVRFIFQLILARFLGPAGYGIFVIGYTVLRLATSIGQSGVQYGFVRFLPIYRKDSPDRFRGVVYNGFSVSLAVSVVLALLLFFSSEPIASEVFNKPEAGFLLKVFAIGLPLFVLKELASSVLQSLRAIGFQQLIINIAEPIISVVFVAIAVLLGYGLLGVTVSYIATVIPVLLLAIYLIWQVLVEMDISLKGRRRNEFPQLLRYSTPMLLAGFGYLALTQIDRLILGMLSSSSTVGFYNAASMIAQQGTLVFAAMTTIFSPFISDIQSQPEIGELNELFNIVVRWTLILSLPIFTVLILFSKEILSLFGEAFLTQSLVLYILVFAQFVYVATGPVGEVLQFTGNQYLVLADTLVMVLANVFLNFMLIPLFGAEGAAIATGVTVGLTNLIILVQIHRRIGVSPLNGEYFETVFVSGLILAAAIFAARSSSQGIGMRVLTLVVLFLSIGVYLKARFYNASELESVKRMMRERL